MPRTTNHLFLLLLFPFAMPSSILLGSFRKVTIPDEAFTVMGSSTVSSFMVCAAKALVLESTGIAFTLEGTTCSLGTAKEQSVKEGNTVGITVYVSLQDMGKD